MKKRIVEISYADGSKQYRCERQGRFIKSNWHTMQYEFCEEYGSLPAVFGTLEEAQQFLHIHPSQSVQSEKVIWNN